MEPPPASQARPLRIALAQINPTVGDLAGNTRRILDWIERARDERAHLVAFPELAITGYPPEDLLLKPAFIRDNLAHLERVVSASKGIAVVVGFVDHEQDIYNAAALIVDGQVCGIYHKVYLPNYGVFDEERYFRRGTRAPVFEYGGIRIGISVCEDSWYPTGPISMQARQGAELLININGSPYHRAKHAGRASMIATRAMDSRAYFAWVNMVGGQDELVFDGNSMIFGPDGDLIAHACSFAEEMLVADLDVGSVFGERLHDTRLRQESEGDLQTNLEGGLTIISSEPFTAPSPAAANRVEEPLSGVAEIYAALVLGTHDYVAKNGFEKVILGLSGGIDSALTATIAADALGAQNVIGVLLPSRYTSPQSLSDAGALAEALGIQTLEISIDQVHAAFEATLAGSFQDTEAGIAEENVQARIRGNLLMALSNKFGYLVLTTGNKSELATGYATLYGDMAGGFAVLKDVTKTMVYELCRFRNSVDGEVIPQSVLTRAPSAELRENQKDEDSLPPYSDLDPILQGYIEEDHSFEELLAAGHARDVVSRVIQLVDRSEYKRRQAPPGVKITTRAFGRDRRMPITNGYSANGAGTLDARHGTRIIE